MIKRTPKRKVEREERQPPSYLQYTCKDCANSYDWCSKTIDGQYILCRCKYDSATEYGRWCKFLRDPACDKYEKRQPSQ